jgi:thymidine kinase
MKPQKKAVELIEKFEKEVYKYDLDTNDEYDMSLSHLAEKCALILVEEAIAFEKRIVKQIEDLARFAGKEFKCEGLFWEEVKQELLKP